MIITKTPFRVSLCGGGSDIAGFYREHGGCVLSASINKYMFIMIHPYFHEGTTVLKYSKTEVVTDIKDIEHSIFHKVLNMYDLSGVELTSMADIPAGTGLGSSSSFTVGLLHTVNAYMGKLISKPKLAELACEIEIEHLKSPIGKQDQYAAAMGGLNFIRFNSNDSVTVEPLLLGKKEIDKLQGNLLMFYTGEVRNANEILTEQTANFSKPENISNLKQMCRLTETMKQELENKNTDAVGEILNESWLLKKTLASGISSGYLDDIYEKALSNGATGGKLLGAGGAGFFLFYCEQDKQEGLRKALNLKELSFSIENDGTSIIFIGDKYWD
ncbi:MAG: GHMP kinase [Oscillospiraceae bacterium]|nr:GHMP kinase [Oscillospiraceae bacterium]